MKLDRIRYPLLLEHLVPYLVVTPAGQAGMELAPFGLPITQVVNPLAMDSRLFLERIQVLDRLSFGGRGLHMPQWIFFDGAAVTGGMFGFALPTASLTPDERTRLELEYPAPPLIPISIYAAIPSHQAGLWVGHNLASLAHLLPNRALKGLGLVTKALALKTYNVLTQCGVTQWNAVGALAVHTHFGPLTLLSAYTPAHTRPDSLTYIWDVDDHHLLAAMGHPQHTLDIPPPTTHLHTQDTAALLALQQQIQHGTPVTLLGPPQGTQLLAPLAMG